MRPVEPLPFVDPRTTPFVEPRTRGELPHLYKDAGSYFVTFRLRDAVGSDALGRTDLGASVRLTRAEIEDLAEPPLGLGSCLLARSEIAKMTEAAIRFFHGRRYDLAAWCIMPNHVHVVVTPLGTHSLPAILHSWKSYTAHRANAALGRVGPLWERESFDHLIRSIEDYDGFINYVENNPVVAGLCAKPEEWPWGSARLKAPEAALLCCGAGVSPAPLRCCGAGVSPAPSEEQARRPHHNKPSEEHGGPPVPQETVNQKG